MLRVSLGIIVLGKTVGVGVPHGDFVKLVEAVALISEIFIGEILEIGFITRNLGLKSFVRQTLVW